MTLLNRYDLYWARSGTFYRYGDGGFINVRIPSFKSVTQQRFYSTQWAYNGNILGTDDDGATVHFGTIS